MDSLRRGRGNAVAAIVLLLSVINPCIAADYTVGDNKGWEFGVDYASWASRHNFRVDDNLIFIYEASFHSVVEVDSSNYESCNPASPLLYDNSGRTVIPLNSTGTRYFICGAPGHCKSANMKVEVTILSREKPNNMQRSGGPAPAPSTKTTIVYLASPSPGSSSAPPIRLDSITVLVSALVLPCFAILFL